ncbi:hypothetical protein N3K66_007168 [Trichothecium roseum]|uniref:Uncharacterized protein n=1 Tax=Trichothecium roseum TaxID=47278 RepID=A0ACC0UUX3_9HYPO|nr:hypothetical protein N3K66_007168 [Trichothecium roseum]
MVHRRRAQSNKTLALFSRKKPKDPQAPPKGFIRFFPEEIIGRGLKTYQANTKLPTEISLHRRDMQSTLAALSTSAREAVELDSFEIEGAVIKDPLPKTTLLPFKSSRVLRETTSKVRREKRVRDSGLAQALLSDYDSIRAGQDSLVSRRANVTTFFKTLNIQAWPNLNTNTLKTIIMAMKAKHGFIRPTITSITNTTLNTMTDFSTLVNTQHLDAYISSSRNHSTIRTIRDGLTGSKLEYFDAKHQRSYILDKILNGLNYRIESNSHTLRAAETFLHIDRNSLAFNQGGLEAPPMLPHQILDIARIQSDWINKTGITILGSEMGLRKTVILAGAVHASAKHHTRLLTELAGKWLSDQPPETQASVQESNIPL